MVIFSRLLRNVSPRRPHLGKDLKDRRSEPPQPSERRTISEEIIAVVKLVEGRAPGPFGDAVETSTAGGE